MRPACRDNDNVEEYSLISVTAIRRCGNSSRRHSSTTSASKANPSMLVREKISSTARRLKTFSPHCVSVTSREHDPFDHFAEHGAGDDSGQLPPRFVLGFGKVAHAEHRFAFAAADPLASRAQRSHFVRQIGVGEGDDPAGRRQHAPTDRRAFALLSLRADRRETLSEPIADGRRAVAAAVVHDDHAIVDAPGIEKRRQSCQRGGQSLGFIQGRDEQGQFMVRRGDGHERFVGQAHSSPRFGNGVHVRTSLRRLKQPPGGASASATGHSLGFRRRSDRSARGECRPSLQTGPYFRQTRLENFCQNGRRKQDFLRSRWLTGRAGGAAPRRASRNTRPHFFKKSLQPPVVLASIRHNDCKRTFSLQLSCILLRRQALLVEEEFLCSS